MVPIVSFVGYSNSGKTTFLVKVITELKKRGYRIGVIKHDGHDFEIDHVGTDTWKHQQAGADVVCIASSHKVAVMQRTVRSGFNRKFCVAKGSPISEILDGEP